LSDLRAEAADLFKSLLREMTERGASDLHVRADSAPALRILGDLEPSRRTEPLSGEMTRAIAESLMNERQRKVFFERCEVDLSCTVPEAGRFRGNVFSQRGLVNIALRVVPTDVPTLEQLSLPPAVKKLADRRRGLILVTGTTGCGKSTTLASMIDYINSSRKAHIITIEDPIEFLHKDKKSIVSQRELGVDTLNYAEALKHVVRQDPDVILLGEMRDLETMSAAITSAQTGHLVLSTIHTIDTAQTISRIVDMFPPHQQNQIRYQLADTLQGLISQRLLKRADAPARVPAVEVLVATPLVKKAIEDNNLAEVTSAVKQGQYYGMQTFNQSLIRLFNDGKVNLDDALAAASNPEEVMLAVRGIESGTDAAKNFS
jgi:twitching motility protein PilT